MHLVSHAMCTHSGPEGDVYAAEAAKMLALGTYAPMHLISHALCTHACPEGDVYAAEAAEMLARGGAEEDTAAEGLYDEEYGDDGDW
jgi:hypothetical protein